jgi:uncharacterized membrane protein YcjF (UPF0283 family)
VHLGILGVILLPFPSCVGDVFTMQVWYNVKWIGVFIQGSHAIIVTRLVSSILVSQRLRRNNLKKRESLGDPNASAAKICNSALLKYMQQQDGCANDKKAASGQRKGLIPNPHSGMAGQRSNEATAQDNSTQNNRKVTQYNHVQRAQRDGFGFQVHDGW